MSHSPTMTETKLASFVSILLPETPAAVDARHAPAAELLAQGVALNQRFNYPAALTAFAEACALFESLGDTDGCIRALNGIAQAHAEQFTYDKASDALRQAMRLLEDNSHQPANPALRAQTLNGIGIVCGKQGQYQPAADHFTEAFTLAEAADDLDEQMRALNGIGMLHGFVGDFASALVCFSAALERCKKMNSPYKTAPVVLNLGNIYSQLHDYPNALDCFFQARRIAEAQGRRRTLTRVHNNIGTIYLEMGDCTGALTAYLNSLRLGEELGDTHGIAGTLQNIGRVAERLGDLDKAAESYRRALALCREIHEVQGEAALLLSHGELALKQGDAAASLAYLTEALRLAEAHHHTSFEYEAHRALVNSYTALGDTAKRTLHADTAQRLWETLYGNAAKAHIAPLVVALDLQKLQPAASGALQTISADHADDLLRKANDRKASERFSKDAMPAPVAHLTPSPQETSAILKATSEAAPQTTLEAALTLETGVARLRPLIDLSWILRWSEPARALALAEEAIELARPHHRTELAQALRIAGHVFLFRGNHAEALSALDESLRLFEELSHDAGRISVMTLLGTSYTKQGDHTRAIALCLAAATLAEHLGDKNALASALNAGGTAHEFLGDWSSALECYVKALRLVEETSHLAGQAATLSNIGNIYYGLGDYTASLDYHFKSLAIAEAEHSAHASATALNNAALVYLATGNHSNALQYQLRGLTLHQELGNDHGQGSAMHTLARIYQHLGDRDAARRTYEAALELRVRAGDKNGESNTLHSFAELLLTEPSPTALAEATELLTRSLRLAEETESTDRLAEAHDALAAACKLRGDLQKSAHHQRLAHRYKQQFQSAASQAKLRAAMQQLEVQHVLQSLQAHGAHALRADDIDTALQKAFALKSAQALTQTAQVSTPAAAAMHDSPKLQVLVRTFGSFSVSIDGITLTQDDWKRRKPRDLFKLLLINYQQAVTTDELIDLLFQNSDAKGNDRAEVALTNAVSHLRKALSPNAKMSGEKFFPFVKNKDRSYTLDLGEGATIDCVEFKHCFKSARQSLLVSAPAEARTLYQRAVSLYTGDFLKEDLYEVWSTFERESLKESYLTALLFLAEDGTSGVGNASDMDESISYAEQALACDRTNERAYAVILSALHRKGHLVEARKVLKRCTQVFQEELGTLPPARFQQYAL